MFQSWINGRIAKKNGLNGTAGKSRAGKVLKCYDKIMEHSDMWNPNAYPFSKSW
jgi:hypothetical protein